LFFNSGLIDVLTVAKQFDHPCMAPHKKRRDLASSQPTNDLSIITRLLSFCRAR
jgi:hypothetical protein